MLDEVNEGIILLTMNNAHASTNLKAVQTWMKTMSNFNPGSNPTPRLNLLGYVQEMVVIARKSLGNAQIQVLNKIRGVLDAVFTEAGKLVGYESKLLGQSGKASESTMKRVARHLMKHFNEVKNGNLDELRLIAKDQTGANAVKQFIENSDGKRYEALKKAISDGELFFDGLDQLPRHPRKWSV